ncbi:hypothetical protein Bca52824_029887 [Brassica carinata]|uniref:Uncharacterized protein n=1 Tax=Brassica carinata TaxID=52824 RepID=A0A8X7V683_BRACI|nr:hypothetical protein Bca52824_029887 [Brassica carinata]
MVVGEKSTSGGLSWSRDDDIAFERALVVYTDETDNRWEKIAGVVPGKTLEQVIEHYEKLLRDVMMIESGNIPLPDYGVPEETNVRERSVGERSIDRRCEYKQEEEPKPKLNRRKAVPWTPLEHSQFLLGLKEYGKGDWRSISRHVVLTRTPTQVASHAQKYFARLRATNRSRQRHSIHDVNVAESSNISAMKEAPTTRQDAQATSQPSPDHHAYEAPTIWNTQATPPPSLDHPTYATPTIWNTQEATSSPSPDHHVLGTPTIWNMQAASQPSANVPVYGTPTIAQSMVGPMVLPYGTNMNLLAPPYMAYGVQHHSVPHTSVPSAPSDTCLVPDNMTYIPTSR